MLSTLFSVRPSGCNRGFDLHACIMHVLYFTEWVAPFSSLCFPYTFYIVAPFLVLEVGSGSGQHLYHFSKDYPEVTFQPTEYDTSLFESIDAYAMELPGHSINRPLELDATNGDHWSTVLQAGDQEDGHETTSDNGIYDLVLTTNVFHISSWVVGQSIVRGAGQVLKAGGHFILYGAFKRRGKFSTPSNEQVRSLVGLVSDLLGHICCFVDDLN